MKLGYKNTTEFSTSELPFVLSNIELIFGVITSPAYWFIRESEIWGRSVDVGNIETNNTIKLATHLLQYVRTPDGEQYELGTQDNITTFVNETSEDFLISVLAGWLTLNATKRLAHKKKAVLPSKQSVGNKS